MILHYHFSHSDSLSLLLYFKGAPLFPFTLVTLTTPSSRGLGFFRKVKFTFQTFQWDFAIWIGVIIYQNIITDTLVQHFSDNHSFILTLLSAFVSSKQ